MKITERLAALRKKMQENEIDMYYIPTNDFHGSEYIHDYFKTREFISGFDGSAGTVIITQEEAGLWTDGRYFLQAETQLEGSGITLYRSGQEGVPKEKQYIKKKLAQGQTIGVDGRLVSAAWAEEMKHMLEKTERKLELSKDLVGEIWSERPTLSFQPAWILSEEFAGESRSSKLDRLRKFLKEREGGSFVLTSLDDIAWLLNIRGDDIPCNPVVFSYLVVNQETCRLFVGENIFQEEDKTLLEQDGVVFDDYERILKFVQNLPQDEQIFVDKHTINAVLLENLPKNAPIVDTFCPIVGWKAVKNSTEVENERIAHIQDGVAVTRFIYWIKHNIKKLPLTELTATEKLEEFRKERNHYLGPSFETIAGYAQHGAIVHYSATEETDISLGPENFFLVDSGGQYLEGTTDITRTILLGEEATQEQKKYYTAVLRGNLNLCAAKFLYGCSGVALDYLARQPLWDMGCDYNHGTGHGVGYLLNVHEAPNAFRYRVLDGLGQNAVLEEGMITSDEPGFYLAGKFGIRLENLILCVKKEKNEYGQFMGFEPLTLVPFDRDAIDPEQMTDREKMLLDEYHQLVYDKIAEYLPKEEQEWLQDVCAPISNA